MEERVLMKGNEALAEAAIRAGCRCYFGYPITPQTEIAAYMARYMPKAGGSFVQAESEVAAANMVLGAAATGTLAMTSSSSPGISLKSEALSYIAASDLPALIVNVMRAGPGLGGIQPSQGDYWQATRAAGHGDFHQLVLAPASVQEMADFAALAFSLAFRWRMPAMILADGTLGQMMEPLRLPARQTSNLSDHASQHPELNWALTGTENQRPHRIVNSLVLNPAALEASVFDRFARYRQVQEQEARWTYEGPENPDILVVCYGSVSRIYKQAIQAADREPGPRAGLFRPQTLWPFPSAALAAKAERCKKILVPELSMGQFCDDVRLATAKLQKPVALACRAGGQVPAPGEALQRLRQTWACWIQDHEQEEVYYGDRQI
ncbi:3-methyl-2-oxobutanoate dehydrogenase subunit VorB [Oscillospiraceae bacterium HV4-5-C5C]|nr:3-methyl-2-oxobutanoate dehydrogenase subunit VorB [Oscillospiraceae bacterium HV4-5-C5C]